MRDKDIINNSNPNNPHSIDKSDHIHQSQLITPKSKHVHTDKRNSASTIQSRGELKNSLNNTASNIEFNADGGNIWTFKDLVVVQDKN